MTATAARVTLHMAASLDGFIANDDQGFAWLNTQDHYEQGADDPDVGEFLKTIGCYVIGARTYETALRLGWPYGDIPTYVLTHRQRQDARASVSFVSGDLAALINDTLRPRHHSIWVVGGSAVCGDCLRLGLADDIRLSIAPVLIGGGVPFFAGIGGQHALHLKESKAYKNGIVSLWYEVLRP